MYISMLPKIDPKLDPIVKDFAGKWQENNTGDFLSKLANSLEVADAQNLEVISSIPDVWARPLLFRMALFGIEDAREFIKGLTKKIEGEWRSILAMFALKELKQVNLKVEYVDLAADDSNMAKVLKALVPKESINADVNSWLTDLYIVYFNGKPIATTSPATLITSAADYPEVFGGQIPRPWSNNGKYLTDPINELQPMEREALNVWLRKLHDNIQTLQLSQNADANSAREAEMLRVSLLNCVQKFINDINIATVNQSFSLTPSHLNLHKGIARLLNETIAGKEVSFEDSNVRLLTNPERSNKKILLVSPEMVQEFANQENISPSQLIVWQGVNANDVTEEALSGERNKIGQIPLKVKVDNKIVNVEYRRPEDFFHERMAVIEPGNAFPGSLNNSIAGITVLADSGLTPILPLKNELLEYFTPAEIADNLSISEDEENIYVYFNFPLSGNGGGANYRFCKTYSLRELIYIQNDVPVIEIWPNLQLENWNKYYLYYENYYQGNELANDIYYVKPYTFGAEIGEDFKAGGHDGKLNKFASKLNMFPEALICSYKSNEARENIFEIGLVLMDKKLLERPKTVQSADWKIGVDFGTSSTMLYFRENKSAARPLVLQPRLFHVTETGGALAQLLKNFIPNIKYQEDGSFLSIFHLLHAADDVRPLIDGHVFMLKSDNTKTFEELKQDIDANLKWKGDKRGKAKTSAYIGQICLQALVEAAASNVKNINWNFSYPTAFSEDQKMTFETTCRNGIEAAYENSGYTYDKDEIVSWSESNASAYYFNRLHNEKKGGAADKKGTNFDQGAVCIDIGAGTTDITIISEQPGRIIYHTSIQYAGRYMFKPIYDNYQFFVEESTANSIDNISLEDGEQRAAVMDAAMRDHSEKYIKDLGFKTEQEEVRAVLQGSQLAMAGLFYYLGKLLGKLHEDNHYKEDKLPRIFVGGNGSRIFKWLTVGNDIEGNKFLSVLENMLIQASGLEKHRKFYLDLSHQPKVEVASGMISDKPNNHKVFFDEDRIKADLFGEGADQYVANAVLAGAEFSQDGEDFSAEDFISAHDVRSGINVYSFEEFKKFIDAFNNSQKLWSEGVPLDEDSIEDLIRETNSYYVGEKGQDVKNIFLEPIFIVELKNLMEMLIYE